MAYQLYHDHHHLIEPLENYLGEVFPRTVDDNLQETKKVLFKNILQSQYNFNYHLADNIDKIQQCIQRSRTMIIQHLSSELDYRDRISYLVYYHRIQLFHAIRLGLRGNKTHNESILYLVRDSLNEYFAQIFSLEKGSTFSSYFASKNSGYGLEYIENTIYDTQGKLQQPYIDYAKRSNYIKDCVKRLEKELIPKLIKCLRVVKFEVERDISDIKLLLIKYLKYNILDDIMRDTNDVKKSRSELIKNLTTMNKQIQDSFTSAQGIMNN